MSDYIKKIPTDDYLTWINKEGKVCPRMPKDWKDEEKYHGYYPNVKRRDESCNQRLCHCKDDYQ